MVTDSDKRSHICLNNKCSLKFKHKDALIHHIQSHLNKRIECDHPGCEYYTNVESHMKDHKQGVHGPPQYKCDCGLTFHYRSKICRHVKQCSATKKMNATIWFIFQMCQFVEPPSNEEIFHTDATGKLKPLSDLEVMLLDGEITMIGDRPIRVPPGYWGVLVKMEDEVHYFYISEDIKAWHMYFFSSQICFIAH